MTLRHRWKSSQIGVRVGHSGHGLVTSRKAVRVAMAVAIWETVHGQTEDVVYAPS